MLVTAVITCRSIIFNISTMQKTCVYTLSAFYQTIIHLFIVHSG